jgi:hypothetical protein
MKTEKLSKPEYAIIFNQFAKKGNRTLMSLDNFTSALKHLATQLGECDEGNPHKLVTKMLKYLKSKPAY